MKLAPECLFCCERMVIDVTECHPCKHLYHTKCILHWMKGREETHKLCPYCRQRIFGLQQCVKHQHSTVTEIISPLVIRHLGLDILKEIETDTLKVWLSECEKEGVRLDSAASALMQSIQENVNKHQANGKLIGRITEEIRQRDGSRGGQDDTVSSNTKIRNVPDGEQGGTAPPESQVTYTR